MRLVKLTPLRTYADLPLKWKKINFAVNLKGQKIKVLISSRKIYFKNTGNKSVEISLGENNWQKLQPKKLYKGFKDKNWIWQNKEGDKNEKN